MLIANFATILKEATTRAQLELTLRAVNTYHLSGITGLLGIKSGKQEAECPRSE
jgi:hypothetical protein